MYILVQIKYLYIHVTPHHTTLHYITPYVISCKYQYINIRHVTSHHIIRDFI